MVAAYTFSPAPAHINKTIELPSLEHRLRSVLLILFLPSVLTERGVQLRGGEESSLQVRIWRKKSLIVLLLIFRGESRASWSIDNLIHESMRLANPCHGNYLYAIYPTTSLGLL
jgi:hypothetical protein